jgi:hypothetical protein
LLPRRTIGTGHYESIEHLIGNNTGKVPLIVLNFIINKAAGTAFGA